MKRKLALILAIVLVLTFSISLTSCAEPIIVQGVDAETHVIKVGNTAATSGFYASVGIPFNYALEAYFWYYTNHTDGYKDADGNKYTIQLKHYDDSFDGAVGKLLTKKLINEDEIFALVGHFGSNTVAATINDIERVGIPMVYAATGVPQLFETERNVMAVQPIYNTEGMSMLATAVAPVEGGMGLGGTKIGVIATTDEAGKSIKAGIELEAKNLGLKKNTDIFYVNVDAASTDHSSAVNTLKSKGCDVVIIATNQGPFINIANQFVASNYDNIKILTSYVSANATTMGGLIASGVITDTREVYAGSWLSTGTPAGYADYVEFARIVTLYAKAKGGKIVTSAENPLIAALLPAAYYPWAAEGVSEYWLNSYAMAGYVAGNVFCQGLTRMSGKNLTWADFIDAMEKAPINIPMGETVEYTEGKRIGIDSLALTKYIPTNSNGEAYRPITSLADIEAAIKAK